MFKQSFFSLHIFSYLHPLVTPTWEPNNYVNVWGAFEEIWWDTNIHLGKKRVTFQVMASVTGEKKKVKWINWTLGFRSYSMLAASLHWSSRGRAAALGRKQRGQAGSGQERWVSQPHQEGCAAVSSAAQRRCPDVNLSSAMCTRLATAPLYSAFAPNCSSGACPSSDCELSPSPVAKILLSELSNP